MARCFQHTIARRFALWRHRTRYRVERLSRAWAYARGRLNAGDAQQITLECRYAAGWHPLLVLTVEDTLEHAREEFVHHAELPRLIADGCARVDDKWASYNDDLYEARRWAIDLAVEYAAAEGIPLTRIEDGDGPDLDDMESDVTAESTAGDPS